MAPQLLYIAFMAVEGKIELALTAGLHWMESDFLQIHLMYFDDLDVFCVCLCSPRPRSSEVKKQEPERSRQARCCLQSLTVIPCLTVPQGGSPASPKKRGLITVLSQVMPSIYLLYLSDYDISIRLEICLYEMGGLRAHIVRSMTYHFVWKTLAVPCHFIQK